jgi:nucleoside phosphorylase
MLIPRTRLIKAMEAGVSPKPAIHYGTVASGDTVMRSGKDRDEIAGKWNVIAFETEGAGVWDSFPCVIIKGVCNYATAIRTNSGKGMPQQLLLLV